MRPFETSIALGGDYWLAYPRDRRRVRKIAAFRDWLLAAIAADPAIRPAGDHDNFTPVAGGAG